MSNEEAGKSKNILLEYSDKLQKIAEGKIKNILEVKERLQMKIIKTKELRFITKFFEEKMREVKILTDEIYKSLSKGEITSFVKDLQKTVETRNNALKASIILLLGSVKEKLPKIQSSFKSINTQDTKMPKFSEYLKSVSLSKILVLKRPGCVKEQETYEAIVKKSMVPKQ